MEFEIKVQIDRPAKDIFNHLAVFSNHADLIKANIDSKQTSEGPVQVGATMRNIAKFMGMKMEEHFVVTEFEPYKILAKESVPGSTYVTGDKYILDEVDGKTNLTFYVYAHLTGFMKLLDGYFGKKVCQSLTADMERLKRDFEEGKIK